MELTWEEIKEILLSGWVIGPTVLLVWIIVGLFIKSRLYRMIKKRVEGTESRIDDILLDVLDAPLNLLIVFLGLTFMRMIMPLEGKLDEYSSYATKIVLILIGIFFVDRLVKGLLLEYSQRSAFRNLRQGAIQGIVRGVIFVIGALIILDSFGVNITPLVTSLGIGSLAVALALQPTLANLFSGLSISMDRSIQVGDLIELEHGERGYVEDIGWRVSKIRLRNDNIVIIPNSRLVDSQLTNYEVPMTRMKIYVRCGVHYESDLDHVEKVAMEVTHQLLEESEWGDKSFEPWFRYEEFADSSINFCIIMMAKDFKGHFLLMSEMSKRLHKRFNEEGIVIPFPLRTFDLQPKHEQFFRELVAMRGNGQQS